MNAEGAIRFAWASTILTSNPDAFASDPEMVAAGSTIGGQFLPWAARIIWGQVVLTGAGLELSSVWAANIIWGDNVIWGDTANPNVSATNLLGAW